MYHRYHHDGMDVTRVFESLIGVYNAVPMLTKSLQIFVMPVNSEKGHNNYNGL